MVYVLWRCEVAIYFKWLSLNNRTMHPTNINNIFHVNPHLISPTRVQSLYILQTVQTMAKHGSNVSTVKEEAAQFASISLSSHPAKCNSQWDRDVGLGISPNCASVVTGTSGSVWKRGRDSNKQASIYFTHWRPRLQRTPGKWWIHKSETDRRMARKPDASPGPLIGHRQLPEFATYVLLFVLFMPCNSVPLFLWSSSLVLRCRRRGTRDTVEPIVVQSCHGISRGSGLILEQEQMTVLKQIDRV